MVNHIQPPVSKEPESNSVNQTDSTPGRILIVDDDGSLRKLLELLLSSQGYDVQVAVHGADAIPLVDSSKFDLIYLDMMMPVMDGIEFLTWFRQRDTETPVVAFTSLVRHEVREKLEATGVSRILYKPVGFEELLSVAKEYTS